MSVTVSSSALSISVVLIVAFAAYRGRPGGIQTATNAMRSWRAVAGSTTPIALALFMTTESSPDQADQDPAPTFLRRRERPWWMQVGFGNRPPEPPVVGTGARVQWWERLRSLIVLAALVLFLGLVLAGVIAAVVALAGYLLEQTAS